MSESQTTSPLPSALVTGASSGIGQACALHLDAQGFRVFAGVRRAEDAETLRSTASERLMPLLVDVSDAASIEAAAKTISRQVGRAGLRGLVNNAGIAVNGPVEFIDLDEVRRQLEVNVVGPVAVTQALLPQLRSARGRIVNIASMGGYLALPFVSPYAASKFAVEGLSDSLRRELRPLGLSVSVIEPGAIESRIWEKSVSSAHDTVAKLPPKGQQLYGRLLARMLEATERTARTAIPAREVARAVHHALTARRPRTRYRVGRDARIARGLTWLLPDRIVDAVVGRVTGVR